MDMLKIIRETAMEKFASEAEVNSFMEGFEKEALQLPYMAGKGAANVMVDFFSHPDVIRAGVGLAAGLAGVGIVKSINSGHQAATNFGLRNKFDMALAQVMANNRVVKGTKPEKVKSYADTIFRFAPHVASDPNLLGSILANAVLGEGIDSTTIKSLVDLEGRYVDNGRNDPLPGIRV